MTQHSPFKFLDSYTKEDKNIFFGRNQEIEQLYQKVFESKLLLVYGVSGTGKSSLIQCGLANKFNDSDWLPVNIRRGSNINDSLNKQITQNLLTEVKETASLKKKINSLYLDHFKPIYLIFDQFEELFIFGSDAEKDEFIQTVKKLVESDIQCKLIFAIREEYLANITEFEREIPSFLENRMRIEKMRPAQAKDCVEGPCRYANISLEVGVSQELLKRLTNDKNEIELTWLQVFLDKLYRTTTTEPKQFTRVLLQQMGKVSDLLGSFLDEQITQSSSPDETLAVLKSFVSIKGTKRQITLEEVQSYCQTIGKQINETNLKIELQQLVSLRILRDKDENGRYELRHDALAAKIYEKITLVEKELMEVRQFVESAFENYQKRDVLLSSDDLDYLKTYESKLYFEGEIEVFLEKSKTYEKSKGKIIKYITTIMGFILFLSLTFLFIFVYRTNKQNSAISDTIISILKSQSIHNKYILAKNAYLTSNSAITQKGIFETYFSCLKIEKYYKSLKSFTHDLQTANSNIIDFNFSKDANYIYGYTSTNSIVIWDIKNNGFIEFGSGQDSIISLEFSAINQSLASISTDSIAKIWDVNGNNILSIKTAYNHKNTNDILDFFTNKNQFVTIGSNKNCIIYNMQGDTIQTLCKHKGQINSIDVSIDNQFIATGSSDGNINIWYYNHIKNKFNIYDSITSHKDTIWSVNFANNNNYILTSSADSLANIYDINGNYRIGFIMHNVTHAKFSESNKQIIFSHHYSSNLLNFEIDRYFKRYRLDQKFDKAMKFQSAEVWGKSNNTDYIFYTDILDNRLQVIEFSPNNELSAVIPFNTNEVWLMSAKDFFKLKSFIATGAKFSPDNKYLATTYKNKINLTPINLKNIIEQLDMIIKVE